MWNGPIGIVGPIIWRPPLVWGGPLFAKTTAAQAPVDGGNERVIRILASRSFAQTEPRLDEAA
jgi:hypothetical protein